MPTDPSVTIDAETAADLREWLWSLNHDFEDEFPLPPTDVTDCLAEIAAAIDGQLGENTKQVEISASRTTFPTRDLWSQSPPSYDPVEYHTRDDPTDVDTGYLEPERDLEREFEELEDHVRAAEFSAAVGDPDLDRVPEPVDPENSAINLQSAECPDAGSTREDKYLTTFHCSVCKIEREIESSHKVSAFVDDCANCGTITRFTAAGVPTPLGER